MEFLTISFCDNFTAAFSGQTLLPGARSKFETGMGCKTSRQLLIGRHWGVTI
jgi:hypothetical protein